MSLKSFSLLSSRLGSFNWSLQRFHYHQHRHFKLCCKSLVNNNNNNGIRSSNSCIRVEKSASALTTTVVHHYSKRNLHTEKRLEINVNVKSNSTNPNMSNLNVNHAILRYEAGSDRFQFSFTLNSGKVFNFERPTTETIKAFEQRIVTNMVKKIKKADVTAKIIFSPLDDKDGSVTGVEEGQESSSLEDFSPKLLDYLLSLDDHPKFQINDNETVNIIINPPEIFQIKFRERTFMNVPLIPNKIEASSNFVLEKSLFKWESIAVDPLTNDSSKKKGNNKSKTEQQLSNKTNWVPIHTENDNQFVFSPTEDLEGSYIRLICTPSDGKRFGFPVTVYVPSPVEKYPVDKFVYEERLARLPSIDTEDPNLLRFLCYNILADTYATAEWFKASPAGSLGHEYRLPLLLKEIQSYTADIICLQEVDEKVYKSDMEPFFRSKLNMTGTFSCKIGNTREGVACFFNPLKLNLLEYETVDLGERMKTLDFWENLQSQPAVLERLADRNTIAQIAVLENKNNNSDPNLPLVILANTHLYFHPNADHIRLLQMMVCIRSVEDKLRELQKKFPDRKIRVFFCGDYNCTPPYSAVRLLLGGKIQEDDLDWTCYKPERLSPGISFEHNLNLKNSHPGNELTNIVINFEGCIDYILYQGEQKAGVELINICPPPSKDILGSIIGCADDQVSLPNFHAPSDHLPLIADFKLL